MIFLCGSHFHFFPVVLQNTWYSRLVMVLDVLVLIAFFLIQDVNLCIALTGLMLVYVEQ